MRLFVPRGVVIGLGVVASSAVACSRAAAPLPAVVDLSAPAASSAAVEPAPPTRASAPVPQHPGAANPITRFIDLDVPREFACTFGADDVHFDSALALAADGAPFAELGASGPLVARLQLDGRVYVVDVEVAGVFVRGFVSAPDAVELHPQRPLLFGDFLVPHPHAALAVVSAPKPGALLLEARPFGDLDTAPTRASTCADVGLEVADFDARAVFSMSERHGALVGTAIPLATDAERAFSVTLTPDEFSSRAVDVLEERGERTRIVWDTDSNVVGGWVPTSSVDTSPKADLGMLYGTGGLGLSGLGAGGIPEVHVCAVDTSLHAEVGGVSKTVGYVRRGVPFIVGGAPRGGLVPISFVDDGLRIADGASLLVDERAAHCPTR
ncbi:MAG: hypothetical protein U0414_06195 [Polyangiaceae bacterium]